MVAMTGLSALSIERRGRILMINADASTDSEDFTIVVASDRNVQISRLTDQSPHAPKVCADASTETIVIGEQIWFPVVDIRMSADTRAEIDFAGPGIAGARYAMNGMFHKTLHDVAPRVEVALSDLEYWENGLFVEGEVNVERFALLIPAKATAKEIRCEIELLSDAWSGEIGLRNSAREMLAVERVPPGALPAHAPISGSGFERSRVEGSLKATVDYLLRTQVPPSASPVSQGLFLFYDHDARMFRCPHWNWSWGPAIKLLLESADVFPARTADLRRVANEVGAASLRFQEQDEGHLGHGFSIVRWSPGLHNERHADYVSPSSTNFPVGGWAPSHAGEKFEAGFEAYYSPADTLYLAGWGWVPLSEAANAPQYLAATCLSIAATDRLLAQYEIVPQDLPALVNAWTDYTREEAGFGVEGFAELYRVTGDPLIRESGEKYIDTILAKLEREDGLWHRHWWRSKQSITPCEYKSRSLGWAEMGLQAAHRMSPDRGYLEKAAKIAEHFMDAQVDSGAWGLVINRPIGQTQESAKGTALWSMLLYRLHRLTGDRRHLEAARRGLHWLIDQQYLGDDPDGHGGVISCSPFSGVDYRRWFKLSCGYTSSFFGLAAIEELRISK